MDMKVFERLNFAVSDLAQDMSRTTTPGPWLPDEMDDDSKQDRLRSRTFPYTRYLPYECENNDLRLYNLEEIVKKLYIAVEAGDFSPGATHWSRELRSWLQLKFDLPRHVRIKLVKLYYNLALARGITSAASERFASMFMLLTKRKHYLRPGQDIYLDWYPLYKELKIFLLPQETNYIHAAHVKRSIRTLTKMCTFCQLYTDPNEIPRMLNEFLPYFSTSHSEGAFVVIGLLNLFIPTAPPSISDSRGIPEEYLPGLFHIWSLGNRSRTFDITFLDLLSRLARDCLPISHIKFGPYGIYTKEQSSLMFTAILRLLDIPVGQASSPYSQVVDVSAGLAIALEKDPKKHPVAHHIARWIVMSLSPQALCEHDSVLVSLEGLFQAIETFFHPSNNGGWTKTLSQLAYYLSDFFVMRWNREKSGELDLPNERKLSAEIKRRFVLSLREAVFMGIYAKSGTAMNFAMQSLQSLAYLEPDLILPGIMQRVYPAMQGLVEVHRTTSSLRALQVLSSTIVKTKGYRIHVTTILTLALPGIDANDLDKTMHTLALIQSLAYSIPFHDLSDSQSSNAGESRLSSEWIRTQVDILESGSFDISIGYNDLDPEDEQSLLKSSTTGFGEFVLSFLGRIFILLENIPDVSRVRSGSPEEAIVNTLPSTFLPLLAALSPDLYDLALNRIADFVSNHVIHQARDAMAFICDALCKVNPEKALKRLIPILLSNIRIEIEENGAASTRHNGADVLPRDRGLVWHVTILSMCVVHVGEYLLSYQQDLLDIAEYMQRKSKGIPAVHVSNFVHHLLLSLTLIYTNDYALDEPDSDGATNVSIDSWGKITDPQSLTIKWHIPSRSEIVFAVNIFRSLAGNALDQVYNLVSKSSPVKRDGVGKDWSDTMSRNLVLLRLLLSGIASLVDVRRHRQNILDVDLVDDQDGGQLLENDEVKEDESVFVYPAGYFFEDIEDVLYKDVHDIRDKIGQGLHDVHVYLSTKQQDDVACFNALYTAYRSWFIDVGIERSAQVVERIHRLFASDIHLFKTSGLRKMYPRPLLLRRANLYHLQRMKNNTGPRKRTRLDEMLLFDLAESAVSPYAEIRRHAQSASESAAKVIIGARPFMIPTLITAFEKAIQTNDYSRMKGAIFTLLLGSLSKTVGRDWRFTPRVIKAFISASAADKLSVQRLANGAIFHVMEYGRPSERLVILDEAVVDGIAPSPDVNIAVQRRKAQIRKRQDLDEEKKATLALELVEIAKKSHWKIANRTVSIVLSMGMRFDTLAPSSLINLITKGSVDDHPMLRGLYSSALIGLFCLIDLRATCKHSYRNYLLDINEFPAQRKIPLHHRDSAWTSAFLESFSNESTEYFVDFDYPGWLVWTDILPVFEAKPSKKRDWDATETNVRQLIGSCIDKDWFHAICEHMKQEPRDGGADRFRMAGPILLQFVFELLRDGLTSLNYEDVWSECSFIYGDGSDKNQHRAIADIFSALLNFPRETTVHEREKIWSHVFPKVEDIFNNTVNPDNLNYWISFVHNVMQGKDPRRSWPLVKYLASFRLDLSSNAAFKESSKVQLLQQCINDVGWHFQLHKPVWDNFLDHLDHPYKGVREAMAQTLASISRTRYHESFVSVQEFLQVQKQHSSVGLVSYPPDPQFTQTINQVFERLAAWRKERLPASQMTSAYTSGSKTILLWLESVLSSHECTQFVPFFSDPLMEEILHMMDIKEDPELMSLAYSVFRHLPNIPHTLQQDETFVSGLIKIGTNAPSWHQRLRVLINIQVFFFRRLFMLTSDLQRALFRCVSDMLNDNQLEVRIGAATTLSGMIRCSAIPLRDRIVLILKKKFIPLEQQRLTVVRHAAVLGLGALVQAFPYVSPPPSWLPEVLTILALRAAADPGMVGQSVKTCLSDFKKTRQDTWHIDVKGFTNEQLEDLEGVLWKSYFA